METRTRPVSKTVYNTETRTRTVKVPSTVQKQLTRTVCKTVMTQETRSRTRTVCEMTTETKTRDVTTTVMVPEERVNTVNVTVYDSVNEEKTETYNVCVPYTTTEEVAVTVCKMVPQTVTVPVTTSVGGCASVSVVSSAVKRSAAVAVLFRPDVDVQLLHLPLLLRLQVIRPNCSDRRSRGSNLKRLDEADREKFRNGPCKLTCTGRFSFVCAGYNSKPSTGRACIHARPPVSPFPTLVLSPPCQPPSD